MGDGSENFDLDFGITGVTKGDYGKRMQLPERGGIDPCEGKVEEKLKKVLSIGTVDSLVMQLLRPEVRDRSLLTPIRFREKVREIRRLISERGERMKGIGEEHLKRVDELLQKEEEK
ncbi:MAG: hypothetical protein LBN94_02665, partial [Puniceicoccales bacterium]|nr:hypothetical protein [Puniceicoccales bacterium]